MHVRPPGHAPGLHFGGDQATSRLHRGQQAEAARMRVGRDPAQLASVCRHQLIEDRARLGQTRLGQPEQGRLLARRQPPWTGRGPAGGQPRSAPLHRPGPGRPGRAVTAGQQRLDQPHVVAPVHPDPGPEQRRVGLRGVRPHPAHRAGPRIASHHIRQIIQQNAGPLAAAVVR